MFKEFVTRVISLAFLCIVSEMIMPEGSMKKYLHLAVGFMMMCVLISPVTNLLNPESFEFSFDSEMTNEEIIAESEAYILKLHEENIREHVINIYGHECEVFVKVNSDGMVKEVIIRSDISDNLRINRLKEELGCENIKIIKRNKDEF